MASSFLVPAFPFHSTLLFSSLVYITTVLALICLLVRKGAFKEVEDDGNIVIMAFFTMAAAVVFFILGGNMSTVWAYDSAGNRIAAVKRAYGFEPAVAARYDSIQNFAQAQENIAFLREISSASINEKEVLNYLMASEIMGLDAEFVRLNGMVRNSDKKRLFQHIRAKALETDASTDPAIARAQALASEM